ncbi:hypothetical protein J437_LFUL003547, partial [Ladona fulva]
MHFRNGEFVLAVLNLSVIIRLKLVMAICLRRISLKFRPNNQILTLRAHVTQCERRSILPSLQKSLFLEEFYGSRLFEKAKTNSEVHIQKLRDSRLLTSRSIERHRNFVIVRRHVVPDKTLTEIVVSPTGEDENIPRRLFSQPSSLLELETQQIDSVQGDHLKLHPKDAITYTTCKSATSSVRSEDVVKTAESGKINASKNEKGKPSNEHLQRVFTVLSE